MKKEKKEEVQQEEQEEQKPDYYEQLLRLKAEFENYRKRSEREKPQLIDFGAQQVLASFLPLYDAMLKAEQVDEKDAKAVKAGLDMLFKEMKKVFEANGVKPMDVLGKPYDAMSQEVLTTLPCKTSAEDGVVTEEVLKGFSYNDTVLRHAKVCVGKFEPQTETEEDEEDIEAD